MIQPVLQALAAQAAEARRLASISGAPAAAVESSSVQTVIGVAREASVSSSSSPSNSQTAAAAGLQRQDDSNHD